MARPDLSQHALATEIAAADHIERLDVMRLAVVPDVERRLPGREAEAVRLVEAVGDLRQLAGARVVAIDGVASRRLRSEALQPSVGGIREPDRSVALHDDVV